MAPRDVEDGAPPGRTFEQEIETRSARTFFQSNDANDLILQARTWERHDVGATPGFNGDVRARAAVDHGAVALHAVGNRPLFPDRRRALRGAVHPARVVRADSVALGPSGRRRRQPRRSRVSQRKHRPSSSRGTGAHTVIRDQSPTSLHQQLSFGSHSPGRPAPRESTGRRRAAPLRPSTIFCAVTCTTSPIGVEARAPRSRTMMYAVNRAIIATQATPTRDGVRSPRLAARPRKSGTTGNVRNASR